MVASWYCHWRIYWDDIHGLTWIELAIYGGIFVCTTTDLWLLILWAKLPRN